jgi:hypothetical protein
MDPMKTLLALLTAASALALAAPGRTAELPTTTLVIGNHKAVAEVATTPDLKLWQFDPDDRTQLHVDLAAVRPVSDPARPGVAVLQLFANRTETVRLEHWAPGARDRQDAPGGAELLMLRGIGRGSCYRLCGW